MAEVPTPDILPAALAVLHESLTDPTGAITPAIYDTAQASLLPEPQRPPGGIEYLLTTQRPDGSWGPADAPTVYRVVPTLAAVGALTEAAIEGNSSARSAAMRTFEFCSDTQCLDDPQSLPDTVAIEHIVPAQLERLSDRLDAFLSDSEPTLDVRDTVKQAIVSNLEYFAKLRKLRTTAEADCDLLPPHIEHTVEVLGPVLAAQIVRGSDGPVGCSPAATAAVLAGTSEPRPAAEAYLRGLAERHGGALPDLAPISTFERIWISAQLVRAGIELPPHLRTAIALFGRMLARDGALGMAPGFVADCDVTSTAVFVLRRCGFDTDPRCLERFETAFAFDTYYEQERNFSPTVNAHVINAWRACPELIDSPESERSRSKAAAFVLDSQREDGTWSDKWHASPYYMAACCAPALAAEPGSRTARAVSRAQEWIRQTQRSDGSWGAWTATLEETAYAVQTLILTADPTRPVSMDRAVRDGLAYLSDNLTGSSGDLVSRKLPPLWHAKELFTPHRIVRATVLSTLYLARMAGIGEA